MPIPNFSDIELTPPVWMGDFSSRDSILPAPAKLDPAAFVAQDAVKVTVGAAGAAKGATSIPVGALSGAIPNNTILNFGELAPVTVTVGAAGAAQAATSVPCAALSGPIPSGTLLDFGANKFARLTANAATGATSVAVAALPTALVENDAATFQGGTKFARLTAAAAAGATSLAVDELPLPLVQNEMATYAGMGKKRIPSGTLVGRTLAERDAGTGYGPADVDGDDEIFLTAREAADLAKEDDMEFYRHHRLVKENFLPGWVDLDADVKAKIRELYTCISGRA